MIRQHDVCEFLDGLAMEIEDFYIFDVPEAKRQLLDAGKHLRWAAAVLRQISLPREVA